MIDFTAVTVAALTPILDPVPVFGQRLPHDTDWPAVRVNTVLQDAVDEPANGWWHGTVQINVLDESDYEGFVTAKAASEGMLAAEGSTLGGIVLQDVRHAGLQYVDDQGFTPPVGRWIVTVRITARSMT